MEHQILVFKQWVNRKKNINELLPGQVDDQVQSLKEYFFKV